MARGRPKGSKNTPKKIVKLAPGEKPTITITSKDREHEIVTKARHAYRRVGVFTKSVAITKAVWNSGSYNDKNIMLAIKAVRVFVNVNIV